MYLTRVILGMDRDGIDYDYQTEVNMKTEFIWFYLEIAVLRKIKFNTQDKFWAVRIILGHDDYYKGDNLRFADGAITYDDVLYVYLKFDFERYDRGDDRSRCEYFVELYKLGLQKAMRWYAMPYEEIVRALDELRENDFVYRWNLRNVLARDYNLKVKFDCALDTNAFTMTAAAYALKSKVKEPLCKGLVVWTEPNPFAFGDVVSKRNSLLLEDGYIYIKRSGLSDRYLCLDLKEMAEGKFDVHYCLPPYPGDKSHVETFRELQRNLRDPDLYKKLFGTT